MANTLKIKRGTAATIPQGQLAEPLFTTDTYDLYIGKGAGGNQRIQNYIASGTSSQFLKGDGTLDSTSYQPLITAGTTLQYYRGDKTFQTLDTSVVPENGPIYFTEPRVRATVLTGLNLSGGGTIAATDSILTAFGKVQNQISALVGGATYQGTWNASTNTPTLASGTGTKGYYYVVSVAGSTNLDGITDWKIGDWAIFNGTTWDKVDNTDAVSSVNGFTGAVNLALDNISDVSAASPTNAQLLRFNGTSSLWENWTPTFEPALTKGNLTEATSSVLTITGGTGAVIGSGTTIQVASAGASQAGVVTTGTQTFAGAKTFSSDVTINSLTAGRGAGNDSSNTVFGNGALGGSTASVAGNTAIGSGSLGSNTSGFGNTALGFGSLGQNTTGQSNTAIGVTSGQLIIGSYNTFVGRQAFSQATSGSNNTIIGYAAGIDITSGSNNTLIGGYTGPASALSGNVIISDGSGNIRFLHNGTNGKLPFLTSNGFVKTSGGDGTLSVDTTSYLPLTGGTLTGALSGTSATFSTEVTSSGSQGRFGGWITGAGYQGAALEVGVSGGSAVLIGYNRTTSVYIPVVIGGSTNQTTTIGGNTIVLQNNGVTALSIASTGAATFSSSVQNVSAIYVRASSNSDQPFINFSNADGAYNWGRVGGLLQGDGDGSLYFQTKLGGSLGTRLTITSTGAATFSSSVTATGIITANNSGAAESILQSVMSYADGYRATLRLNNTHTGGNIWELYSTNNSDGVYSGGKFGIRNTTTDKYALTITSGGNVGIGTTSPNALTEIRLNANNYGNNLLLANTYGGNDVGASISFGHNTQSADPDIIARVSGYIDDRTSANRYGSLRFYTATGGTLSERMRITSGGLVGIGNTNPSSFDSEAYQLVVGTGTGNNGITIYGGSAAKSKIHFADGTSGSQSYVGSIDYLHSVDAMLFATNGGQERMRITSVGEVLINTTSDAGDYKLQVNGNTYTAGTITTHAPAASSIGTAWKLGGFTSTTVSAVTTGYILVEVGGTTYYLGLVNPL